jgi:hypothetical protein
MAISCSGAGAPLAVVSRLTVWPASLVPGTRPLADVL